MGDSQQGGQTWPANATDWGMPEPIPDATRQAAREQTVALLAAGLRGHMPRHTHPQGITVACSCTPGCVMTEDQWCLHAAEAQVPQ